MFDSCLGNSLGTCLKVRSRTTQIRPIRRDWIAPKRQSLHGDRDLIYSRPHALNFALSQVREVKRQTVMLTNPVADLIVAAVLIHV